MASGEDGEEATESDGVVVATAAATAAEAAIFRFSEVEGEGGCELEANGDSRLEGEMMGVVVGGGNAVGEDPPRGERLSLLFPPTTPPAPEWE